MFLRQLYSQLAHGHEMSSSTMRFQFLDQRNLTDPKHFNHLPSLYFSFVCDAVVIFFWFSGIMEYTCMLFTFENGVPLMR